MHSIRIATAVAVVSAATVVVIAACSEPKAPTAASPAYVAVASDNLASVRAERAAIRSRIPAEYAWIGEEHNRVMREGITQYQSIAKRDPSAARRLRRDCEWGIAVLEREMVNSTARGGFTEGETRQLFAQVGATARGRRVCHAKGASAAPMSVFASPFAGAAVSPVRAPFTRPRTEGEEGDAGIAVLDQLVAAIDDASDPSAVNAAIGAAANAAAGLSGLDQQIAYSGVSLALSSAELWGEQSGGGGSLVDQSPYAMALFMQNILGPSQKTFGKFVKVDLAGCAAGAGTVSKYIKDWRPIGAGCFLTGVGASLSYFLM